MCCMSRPSCPATLDGHGPFSCCFRELRIPIMVISKPSLDSSLEFISFGAFGSSFCLVTVRVSACWIFFPSISRNLRMAPRQFPKEQNKLLFEFFPSHPFLLHVDFSLRYSCWKFRFTRRNPPSWFLLVHGTFIRKGRSLVTSTAVRLLLPSFPLHARGQPFC